MGSNYFVDLLQLLPHSILWSQKNNQDAVRGKEKVITEVKVLDFFKINF